MHYPLGILNLVTLHSGLKVFNQFKTGFDPDVTAYENFFKLVKELIIKIKTAFENIANF